MLTGKHIDRRAACQKVLHHLPGHVLRIRGNTFRHDTVIAGENQHGWLTQTRLEGFLNQANLQRQSFQLSQTADRFGFVIDGGLQFASQCFVLR